MRPGDFSPGNGRLVLPRLPSTREGFNEAGGFLPRKLVHGPPKRIEHVYASMRPGDFSPGNPVLDPSRRADPLEVTLQ